MAADVLDRVYSVLARAIPDAAAGYVLPGLARQFRETGTSSPAPEPIRVLIGPANSAGQGLRWARAAETLPGVAAVAMMFRGDDDVFGFTADHVVPAAALVGNHRWRRAQADAVRSRFTHVLIESATHVHEPRGDVAALAAGLTAAGVRVGLVWHGSDIRDPEAHARREPDSPFAHGYPDTEVLTGIARRNARLADALHLPEFVSTPDLLADRPRATWLPVVVDAAAWAGAPAPFQRDRPVVVHAPSRAGMKGTAEIAEAVRRLDAEGIIEYREVTGVAAADMPGVYGGADIVLDQFLLGSYGVAACEAMAAGRLVIGHTDDAVREHVRTASGHELPILRSRAGEIEDVLRGAVRERARSAARAAAGPEFVRTVHGDAGAGRALADFLGAGAVSS